jgi:hypothetical protein
MPHTNCPEKSIFSPSPAVIGNDFSPRYLAAKKSVDDRALNRYVWESLCRVMPQAGRLAPIRILEIGAGIGTMLARAIDWGLLTGNATYVITDCVAGLLHEARHYLSNWAGRHGHHLSWSDDERGRLQTANAEVSLLFAVAGAKELADGCDGLGPFDLLIAHAVLDLIDFPALLPRLLLRLEGSGLAYLTGNFDGETVFLPEYDGEEEKEIIGRYHASMEARLSGASRTGRRLLTFLQTPGLELLAAGSSDWLVHPESGCYRDDEEFFLQAIIATVEQELRGKNGIPPAALRAWTDRRRQQVQAATLTFFARHLDFLVRRLSPSL